MLNTLIEYIKEIFDDIEEADDTLNDDSRPQLGGRKRGIGGFVIVIPHILGIIVGCAVARMFSLNAEAYIHFSILFVFIGGVYKSCSFDKMSLKKGIIKNALIMLIYAAIFGIAVFLGKHKK